MATKIYQCMQKISDAIVENKDFLTDLDREIGDADQRFYRGYETASGG